jgi:hypothetical protein
MTNTDKETIEKYKPLIGKKVRVWGSRYKDVKFNNLGHYAAKHVDIPMHYILLEGEKEPRIFHTFEIDWM